MTSDEAINILESIMFFDKEKDEALHLAIKMLKNKYKYGEWILYPSNDCTYRCSNCGFIRDAYLLEKGTYCPNCGADMQERREDDKG